MKTAKHYYVIVLIIVSYFYVKKIFLYEKMNLETSLKGY